MQSDTTQFSPLAKLTLVAGAVALCIFGLAFVLPGALRPIAQGAAAGLAIPAMSVWVDAYRRRVTASTSRGAVDAKARNARMIAAGGAVIGGLIGLLAALASVRGAFIGGLLIGLVAFMAMLFSPLFSPVSTASISPLARMTSSERAARLSYEEKRE